MYLTLYGQTRCSFSYIGVVVKIKFIEKMSRYDTSVVYRWEKETSEWMEGKAFVIPAPQNCVPPPEKPEWDIETLAARLVEKKIIPASIQFDAQLYAVLIAQMELQLLRNIVVPEGVGFGNFYRNVDTKGLRVSEVTAEKDRCKVKLEKWMGINIDHWYKIDLVEKKRKAAQKDVETWTKRVSSFILLHNYYLQYTNAPNQVCFFFFFSSK
jgi:hypothetical protein